MNDHLKDFLHYLVVERGLAENTITSYNRDLSSYLNFLQKNLQITDPDHIKRVHIMQFLKGLKDEGKSSRTCPSYHFHPFVSSIFSKGPGDGK